MVACRACRGTGHVALAPAYQKTLLAVGLGSRPVTPRPERPGYRSSTDGVYHPAPSFSDYERHADLCSICGAERERIALTPPPGFEGWRTPLDMQRPRRSRLDGPREREPEITAPIKPDRRQVRFMIGVMTRPHQAAIFGQVSEAREEQDRQWGGPEHDDTRSRAAWLILIEEHLARARGDADGVKDADEWRRRVVSIAAVAIAAIEAHDRRRKAGG